MLYFTYRNLCNFRNSGLPGVGLLGSANSYQGTYIKDHLEFLGKDSREKFFRDADLKLPVLLLCVVKTVKCIGGCL